jgi:hypothetical protein
MDNSDNLDNLDNLDLFLNIYRWGTYYNPAYRHYGQDVVVHCDKCLQSHLTACLGWTDHDLCLDCAADIDYYAKSDTINGINSE